jgi:diacylglycerol kinase family enzyme
MVHLDGSGSVEEALASMGVRHSESFSASTIELTFDEQPGQPLSAQIDGEEFPATPEVRIEVKAHALRVIVPVGAP